MLWSMIHLISKMSLVTPDFFYVFYLILSFSTCSQSFKKICTWERLGANVLKCARVHFCLRPPYYMASSVSGQDEPHRTQWLTTRAGKMELSCLLGTSRCVLRKPNNKSFTDQALVKMAGIGLILFFCVFMDLASVSSISTQKNEKSKSKSKSDGQ